MGMIDFQGLQWCKGIRDVQYHLINSLEPEALAANEDDVIDDYLAALRRIGVAEEGEGAAEDPLADTFGRRRHEVVERELANAGFGRCRFEGERIGVVVEDVGRG